MSPSSPLYLLTLVGLMLAAEGQTLTGTNVSPGDAASVSVRAQTEFQELQPVPATPAPQHDDSPELQPVPATPAPQSDESQPVPATPAPQPDDSPKSQPGPATPAPQPDDAPKSQPGPATPALQSDGLQSVPAAPALQPEETTQKQRKTERPMEDGMLLTRAPGSEQRHLEGPPTPREETPFYYDEYTLRKRGLLIAAVLFITGIVILTSGKCRRLPQLCQKNRR